MQTSLSNKVLLISTNKKAPSAAKMSKSEKKGGFRAWSVPISHKKAWKKAREKRKVWLEDLLPFPSSRLS